MPGTAYNFREERRKEKIRKRMKSGERKYFFSSVFGYEEEEE